MAGMKSKSKKILIWITVVLTAVGGSVAFLFYQAVYAPNLFLAGKTIDYIYIPSNSNFDDVMKILSEKKILQSMQTFEWLAKRKNYTNKVLPGRYRINNNMSNSELINLLRSGKQEPLKLTFNNIRTKVQLAGIIGSRLEADSNRLLKLLHDSVYTNSLGFTVENIMCMFIPNTYEFYWTTSDSGFIKRMQREYENFWNENRKAKASKIGMTKTEVGILASIVDQETNMNDDKPIVAGVYINRLKKNMPLEADPTLKFALGDFSIKRILNADKQIESPYNTYKYAGLPPGPICIPSITSIDAVLNYSQHEYLFFCAREDFSGYSNFACTYEQHLVNARKYQSELNRRNIKR